MACGPCQRACCTQKQDDKANSVCHELQTNHLLKSERVMKSHTYRINRGVRDGASWEKVLQNIICSDEWRA